MIEITQIIEEAKNIRDFILNAGPFAPLALILIQTLQIIFFPFPGELTGLIAGYIFGAIPGFVYSSIGLSIGSLLAFKIARLFRKKVHSILVKTSTYKKFEFLLLHQGIFVVSILFLFPGFPKDFLCYLLGLTRFPTLAFIIIASFCRMPGTLMLTLQGDSLYKGDLTIVIILFTIVFLIILVMWLYKEKIYRWVERKSNEESL